MQQEIYLNALNRVLHGNPKYLFALLEKSNNDAEKAWETPDSKLTEINFGTQIRKLFRERGRIDPKDEWEKLKKLTIHLAIHPTLTTNTSNHYPFRLTHIACPPALLYILGDQTISSEKHTIAVVGSRNPSPYGHEVTENVCRALTLHDIIIVSGLALGVDSIAHQSAINAKNKTIGVAGTGLDIVYPILNKKLVQDIITCGGAIISEFPLHTPPLKENFPQRNRIIAGISENVLITEAAKKSGSLITARYALEQNKDIFAVPGSIYNRNSQGTNDLIKQGALLIASVDDLFDALQIPFATTQLQNTAARLSDTQQKIYDLLSHEPISTHMLTTATSLSMHEINVELSLMELSGVIKNIGNNQFIKTRRAF